MARLLRGTECPVCGRDWQCGQDVRERNPSAVNGIGTCAACLTLGSEEKYSSYYRNVDFCFSHDELLTKTDAQFLTRISGLTEEDVEPYDLEQLFKLVEKIESAL